MVSVLKDIAGKAFTSKAEVVNAVNAALTTWAGQLGISVTPFITADFPDIIKVSTVAHLIGRKVMGLPSITYQKRDLSTITVSSFSSLVAAYETDYNSDPATGYVYYGMFDTFKGVATKLDTFLSGSPSEWLAGLDLKTNIRDKYVQVYTRPSSDPRLEHITWLNGLLDWKLLYKIESSSLVAYQNMPGISDELKKSLEIIAQQKIDDEIYAIDLYDFLLRNIYRAVRAKYSYSVTKSNYIGTDGAFTVAEGFESIINRLLSMRHTETLYPIMFM